MILTDIIEYIGTFAFAISGIRMAGLRRYDWFGAYVVGLATAVGGGTIRDLFLDITPFWMAHSGYLICTAVALLFVILFRKNMFRFNNTFFIFDTIGLALFVVVGFEKTIALDYPYWLAIVMGVITGAFGGVIRDVLLAQMPLIFRKEIYAMSCVLGGIVYALCDWHEINQILSQIFTINMVVITRILAVKYKIGLPQLRPDTED